MVALTLSNFGGMIPAVEDDLLPDNQAGLSQNAWVYSGALEGFREATPVHTLANPLAKKAFRIPIQYYDNEHIPDSYWLEFLNPDTDVISSPSVGDTFERFYWAADDITPKYNTKARIAAGSPAFELGIPAPTIAPYIYFGTFGASLNAVEPRDTFAADISLSGVPGVRLAATEPRDTAALALSSSTVILETRAYVYTWVSAYGEEGPPSPATLQTGTSSAAWNVKVTAPDGSVTTGRNIDRVRIYRTITGSSGATTYYFVAEMPIGTTDYVDANQTSAVAGNNILSSTFYQPPPADLKGIIAMPNGIVAGFRANEVWFCQPYLPHAWPSIYTLAVENQVVGLGVVGQTLIVCTTGSPYAISGVNPASMSQSRLAFSEPCLSRGSIISTPVGVAYASPNGVAVAVAGQVQVISRNLITKDKWLDANNYLLVSSLRAAALNGGYYCWGSLTPGCFDVGAFNTESFQQEDYIGAYRGAFVDLTNPRVAFNKLFNASPTINCYADTWTGEVLIIRDGQVKWLDVGPARSSEAYVWRSKVFTMPNKRNLEAMRVWFKQPQNNNYPMGTGTWVDELNWDDDSQWLDTQAGEYGFARVYADGVLRFTRALISSGDLFRLPSGFKAQDWQIEIEANVKVTTVEFATSAKELGSV